MAGKIINETATTCTAVSTTDRPVTPASMAGIYPGVYLYLNGSGQPSAFVRVVKTTATTFNCRLVAGQAGGGVGAVKDQAGIGNYGYFDASAYTAINIPQQVVMNNNDVGLT